MESKNLDAALAAKNTATDGAYIMAQDASGNTIRIAKADLASVLAEELNSNNLITFPSYGILNAEQLEKFKSSGCGYVALNVIPGNLEGHIFCLPNGLNGGAIQIYVSYNGDKWMKRAYNWSSKTWTDWSDL